LPTKIPLYSYKRSFNQEKTHNTPLFFNKKWFLGFLFKSVCDLLEIKNRYSLTNFRYFQKELSMNLVSERKKFYICACKQE